MNALHAKVLENQITRYHDVVYKLRMELINDSSLSSEERGIIDYHMVTAVDALKSAANAIHDRY